MQWIAALLALLWTLSLPAQPKVLLLNDTSAWYHWGCTGTSTALKEAIQRLNFDVETVPILKIYALDEIPPFEQFDDPKSWERFSQANPTLIQSLQSADAIIINGEGTLHDLRRGPKTLLYLAHIAKKHFHKHVEIINHSVYPKDDPSLSADLPTNFEAASDKQSAEKRRAEELYQKIYREVDFVAIREPISFEEMSHLGIEATQSFDCLPLYIRDHYPKRQVKAEKTIVIAGSVAFSEAGLQQLCHYLEKMTSKGFTIEVLIGAAAYPSKDDQIFVELLKTHCHAPWKLIDAHTMNEWLSTIDQATLLVSGRFHHTIAAFCLNTPFITLNSNTWKVHALCALFEVESPLLYSDPNLATHLLARTEKILSSPPPDHREKFQEWVNLAEKNLEGLKQLTHLRDGSGNHRPSECEKGEAYQGNL